MRIVVSRQLLNALSTGNGGYTRRTLKVLGVSWPPVHGWLRKMIGETRDLDTGNIAACLREGVMIEIDKGAAGRSELWINPLEESLF